MGFGLIENNPKESDNEDTEREAGSRVAIHATACLGGLLGCNSKQRVSFIDKT